MNIRQIRHFLAMLDNGSLSAAAEVVHLSQPALSRSIRSLEDELGVPLFDRNDRRLRPTLYARAYELRARRMVLDEKEGARLLALMQSGEAGSLALGMGSSLAPVLLSPLALDLMQNAPRVQLRSVIETSERLVAALLAERLDFFVGDIRVAQDHADLSAEVVYPCTFGWYVRRGHPLAGQRQVTIDDIRPYPLLAAGYYEPSLARRFGELYGLAVPVIDHFAFTTDDVGTVHSILEGSDAVVPATDLSMIAKAESGEVVALDVNPPLVMDMTLGIVHHADRTLAPVAQRAFEIVRDCFAAVEARIAARALQARRI
ncbi:LysR family transcriptional regulator [Paraburkholderia sediminicola]|uniref:LysR family transcriptional regulator n=1 Tax=Paraburkholderia sediminicola TaxID=458836 RepID=UPI0038B6BFDD